MTASQLILDPSLAAHLPADDPFSAILSLQGKTFRHHKNRRTFKAAIGPHPVFIKIHDHTSWGEILKNALRLRWPVLTAEPEYRAIQKLASLNIPTTPAFGLGIRGASPHKLQSFLITQSLENFLLLSDLPAKIQSLSPRDRFCLQKSIITRLAEIARTLHTNGVNHRDFYLCHFMLPDQRWSDSPLSAHPDLHVIDLHRVQIRPPGRTPSRWIIKDLAGLLFSSFDCLLSSRDLLRFLRIYGNAGLRDITTFHSARNRSIFRRALRLYLAEHGKSPALPAGLASSSRTARNPAPVAV